MFDHVQFTQQEDLHALSHASRLWTNRLLSLARGKHLQPIKHGRGILFIFARAWDISTASIVIYLVINALVYRRQHLQQQRNQMMESRQKSSLQILVLEYRSVSEFSSAVKAGKIVKFRMVLQRGMVWQSSTKIRRSSGKTVKHQL